MLEIVSKSLSNKVGMSERGLPKPGLPWPPMLTPHEAKAISVAPESLMAKLAPFSTPATAFQSGPLGQRKLPASHRCRSLSSAKNLSGVFASECCFNPRVQPERVKIVEIFD